MAWIRFWTIAAAIVAVAGTACAGAAATCLDAPLTREAQTSFEVVAAQIDFTPIRPCGYGYGFAVRSVVGDTLPGTPPQRRISFIVDQNGKRSYVFSETRAAVMSTQIPQGTHRLRVSAGSVVAEGFAGPSGSGGETAYLRWLAGGVTYELDATLGRALDEAGVQRIATALMVRGSAQRPASLPPSSTASGAQR